MWMDLVTEGLKEIKELIDKKDKRREKAFEAVEAINRAANRTTIYITKSVSGTYKSSQELSDLWMDAAKAVRNLDQELYWRLLGKAEFWSNPEEWPEDRVKKAKISLLEIKRSARKILQKAKK